MLNLLLTYLRLEPSHDHDEGFLGKLALWARWQARYGIAMARLRRLDDRDLDDLGIGPAHLPQLAWRHASGLAPLMRPYR